ncbi:Asp-tRNA(Asn)/Glu-tRNA(Gln) amidotransferase A subunit family amidase [Brevundimonas vesicularis]|uniref:hypothetical protein n=1 Tax=Brevundimonas vesicularis TaxID=41276 RepID=UPI0027893DDD|nr:hypothetical protein [Brevundimonas vesicularis]MDQ1192005.1 Asp-tRNA(Asn)/Glu-tRNA(Gln) amidotransferase A subunit family amidase [Brevundimonas vesicularis]
MQFSQMDEKRPRSPQEKKSLSYANDCRNTYGENDKASRKAIPARKAGENRKVRRKANQALNVIDRLDDENAAVIESSLKQDLERVGGWTKSPDVSLAEYMEVQARLRSWRNLSPNRQPDCEPKVS